MSEFFCEETERLAEYIEAKLPEEQREIADRHLAHCSLCRRVVAVSLKSQEPPADAALSEELALLKELKHVRKKAGPHLFPHLHVSRAAWRRTLAWSAIGFAAAAVVLWVVRALSAA